MGTGYTRNDSANNIADGNVINASDLDGEFDAVQAAFNGTTGHSHDGTTGEGPQIAAGGIASNAVTTAKILDANVTLAKMAANSIDSDQYVDGSIDTVHIANDAVTGDKLANNIQIAGTLGVTGETTLTTHLNMGDGDIIKLGAGSDLQIFHDGSNSRIQETGTGNLFIDADASVNFRGNSGSENMAKFNANGAVQLYYNDGEKLATTNTGIDVTGVITTDGMTTSADINFGDNDKAVFGASSDLQIYHDGNNSIIHDNGTGVLKLRATDFRLSNAGNTLDYIACTDGGDVDLSYNGAVKFSTTSTGVSVTGNVAVSGTVDGRDVASDGSKLDGIESGATADQSASEILTLIKTVDGSGSGLDADALDGIGSSSFLRSDAEDTKTAGALNFSDNVLARFGTGNDLQIYHDGSNSYIIDNGTGNLRIRASDFQLQDSAGYSYIEMSDNGTGGTVELKNNASTKLTTKSDGVLITGELEATTLDINGTSNFANDITLVGASIAIPDNEAVRFGAGQDLQLYHDASSGNSYVLEQGTGSLIVQGTNIQLRATDGTSLAEFNDAGAVNLRYSGDLKLATTSTGVDISGDINNVYDVYVENKVVHSGDTDTFTQFHAANEWRVVTGNTEKLEINNSYLLLGANSVGNVQTISVSGSVTPNLHVYNSFVWTLTGNITLSNPTTEATGMSGVLVFIHSGAGRTVSLGTQFRTVGGAGLTLSGTAGAIDIVPYFVRATGIIMLGTPQLAFS